jgi:GntR family transcriptional regulator
MLIRIDPGAPDPIYEQIALQVKGAVARGELAEGDKLPSVRELAREVSLNPNTVIRAYTCLEQEGIIYRRQGAGCFITGATSRLNLGARRRQLSALMRRSVTEAYHLGFSADDIRKALGRELQTIRFPGTRRKST